MRGSHSAPSNKATGNRVPGNHGADSSARAAGHPQVQSSENYSRNAYSSRRRRFRAAPVVIALVALACVAVAIVVGLNLLGPKSKTGDVRQGEEIVVTVAPGAPTINIAEQLVDSGVIASSAEFISYVEKAGQSSSLQSGTYVFTGGDGIDTIVRKMTSGETGYMLTIPEGFTLKQIAERVEQASGIKADEFYALTQQAPRYAGEYPFLNGVYNGSMEGFLFADTYRIEVNATADDIIRVMLNRFSQVIGSVDMSYAQSKNLTLYDVVTLASMVEKEHRVQSDMAPIAAVFYNRLREGVVLGSDITTYYAVGKDLSEDLTNEDLMSDSPYNTRHPQHYGLPAGPVCSPSLDALNAAAHPAQVDYMYFFYSKSQNQTMFFTNEADFSAAWAQYSG